MIFPVFNQNFRILVTLQIPLFYIIVLPSHFIFLCPDRVGVDLSDQLLNTWIDMERMYFSMWINCGVGVKCSFNITQHYLGLFIEAALQKTHTQDIYILCFVNVCTAVVDFIGPPLPGLYSMCFTTSSPLKLQPIFCSHIKISITAIMAVVSESKCSSQTPEKHLSATKAQHGHQPLHISRVFPTINIMVGHGDKWTAWFLQILKYHLQYYLNLTETSLHVLHYLWERCWF